MRTRLAWAFGGFVVFALVVYRFLTRGPAPAPLEQAPGADGSLAADDAPPAPSGAATPDDETSDPEGAAGAAAAGDDDQVPGDPDERVAELRRKLELAREAEGRPEPPQPTGEAEAQVAPAEPPLDDRRRAVHDAGRAAAETMRRTADDPRRGPGTGPDPGAPGPGSGTGAG